MTETLADHIEGERRPKYHGGVAGQDGDGFVRAELQTAEQVVKITEADRARDHAEKGSVVAGNAPAEHDGISAAMQRRTADEQTRVGLVAMNPEELLVAAIVGYWIQRRGVDGQSPFGVEHLDRAEMFRSRGMIEQDQMPNRLGAARRFRPPQASYARPAPER